MCSVWVVPNHNGIVGAADFQRLYECMFLSATSQFCIGLSFVEPLHDTPILDVRFFPIAFVLYDDYKVTTSPPQRRE